MSKEKQKKTWWKILFMKVAQVLHFQNLTAFSTYLQLDRI